MSSSMSQVYRSILVFLSKYFCSVRSKAVFLNKQECELERENKVLRTLSFEFGTQRCCCPLFLAPVPRLLIQRAKPESVTAMAF